jgi:hypothetical protein
MRCKQYNANHGKLTTVLLDDMTGMIHHKMYFKIATESLESAKLFEESIKSLKLDPSPWIKIDLVDKNVSQYFESAVESIVFSGLTIEAFINCYALDRLSKSKFKRFNNFSLKGKWSKIPMEVTGKEIPEDSQAMIQLAALIKSRNNLVHYKAGGGDEIAYYTYVGAMLKEAEAAHPFPLTMQAESNVDTIRLLIDELHKIDSTISRADLMFDQNDNRWFELWSKS